MLRNLLYSIFFHLIFCGLMFLSTVNYSRKISFIKADVTPMVLNFVDDGIIEELKEIKGETQNEKTRDMNLEQKIDLYKKIKNNKTIEQTLKQYEKSGKTIRKEGDSKEMTTDNEFSYHYTPIYVAESKLDKKDKEALLSDFLKKEEMRKKMKEKGIIPEIDLKKGSTIKDVKKAVDRAKNKIVLENKDGKNKSGNKESNTTAKPKNETNNSNYINEIDEIALQMLISQNKIDDELKHIREDEIFTEEDLKKIKDISSNETNKIKLSLRERRNIIQQIKNCYKNAILKSKKDSKSVVNIVIDVKKNGVIDLDNIYIEKEQKDKNFLVALDNVKTALVFCSPLRGMPIDKYNLWRKMAFTFDSNKLD